MQKPLLFRNKIIGILHESMEFPALVRYWQVSLWQDVPCFPDGCMCKIFVGKNPN